jgi:hypothetical protein
MHDKNKAAPAEAAQQNTRANYKRFTAHGKSSSVPRKRRYRHGKQDYESLKASLTATAITPREYELACTRAAKIAGV